MHENLSNTPASVQGLYRMVAQAVQSQAILYPKLKVHRCAGRSIENERYRTALHTTTGNFPWGLWSVAHIVAMLFLRF
jgi:hypothetical protein